MPQPRVLDLSEKPAEPSGVANFFNRISESYKEGQDVDTIGNILKDYQSNREKANAWEDAYLKLQKSNVSPSRRVEAQKALIDSKKTLIDEDKALNAKYKQELDTREKLEKEKVEQEKTAKAEAKVKSDREAVVKENETIFTEGGKSPEEAARLAPLVSTATARAMVKPTKGGFNAEDTFNRTIATESAKEVPKLENTIARGKDILENIDTIEKLSTENLSGPIGYGKALFNTESASQVRTLSATNLDTVIKLFNPVGAVPVSKLNWIRNTFAISPYDNQSTVAGKLNTERIITNQAVARAKERVALLKKYHGNIPEDVVQEFDNDTGNLLDALQQELAPNENAQGQTPDGKVRVKDKKTGKTGTVTPYPGMEQKYDTI